jgi:hypothetical protein
VGIVFVLSILFNVPRFFQIDIVDKVIPGRNRTVRASELTAMGNSQLYDVMYLNVFYTALILILPLIVMIVLNAIIIMELQMSKKRMEVSLRGSTTHYIGCVYIYIYPTALLAIRRICQVLSFS